MSNVSHATVARGAYALCALIASLFVISCVTARDADVADEPADLRILVENAIITNIVSDPLLAAQLVGYHRKQQGLFLAEDLAPLSSSLEQALSQQIDQRIEQEQFPDALALFRSIELMGYDPPPALSEDRILHMEIEQHLAQDNYLPLLFSAYNISDYLLFTVDQLSAILDIAIRHNHYRLAQSILGRTSARYPALAGRYQSALNNRAPTLAEMLNGTVTVWVDKGFAITDGVGHADRVFGSAFFVDARGYLITNYHVIASEVDPEYEGFSRLYIRMPDNSNLRVPAKVVGYDRLLDIALLKTEIEPEYIFALQPSDERHVSGTEVYALGSPVGLDKSIASGIISSPSRQFLPIGEALQIDAPVNPGNSGGPLVDGDGALVGIVYAGIPQFQGINFAIPISWVWHAIPSLFSATNNNHLWLGVAVQKIDNRLQVVYVASGSPADEIDIKAGDVLTRIGGQTVREISEAQSQIIRFHTTQLVEVEWDIDGMIRSYPMKIQKRPFSPIEEALMVERRERLFAPLFGMDANRLGGNPNSRNYVITNIYRGTIADELGFAVSDPFTVLRWDIDEEKRIAIMQVNIKKTKNGFSASGLQIIGSIDLPNFI